MKKLKLILGVLLIIMMPFITYRIYKIQSFTQYQMNGSKLVFKNEIYKLTQDDSIFVTNEGELLGIAIDNKLKLSDYIFPHYMKSVEINTGEECIMVSSLMWDGIFKKEQL